MKRSEMIFRFLSGAKHYFVLALVFLLTSSLSDMIRPRIIAYTVDSVLGDLTGGLFFGGLNLREHLWIPALAVILCTLFSVVLFYFYQISIAKGGELFVKQMRDQLFSHIEQLSIAWHSSHQTGDIIQRCTNDVEEVKTFVSDQLVNLVRMLLTIVLSLTFIFRYSWKLGLLSVASVPFLGIFSVWFHGIIGKSFQECDENEAVLSTIAQENLTGVRVVRAFGREGSEKLRFSQENDIVTTAWVKLGKNFTTYFFVSDIITGLIMMGVLCWGSAMCLSDEMTVGSLLAVITYLTMLIRPVRSMGRVLTEMSKTGVSMNRLHEIMVAPVEEDDPEAIETAMNQDITFSHVSFAFPGQPKLLDDLNFTIPAGSTLGILGSTGSGKSTIAHLLTRLYPLNNPEAAITIGGTDIRQIKASWLRKNIGFVLQEPFLFSRTIAENLGITQQELIMEDIKDAASLACLDHAVEDFPKGYDTFVGERGVTLSGGQKQRAAIARTLALKTPILIFDDSLSAVDAETDAKIRANLKKRMDSTTTILISHRINTLMSADQILVLENGRITDFGTHEELISRPGLYQKIYQIQQGKEVDLSE